MSKPITPTPAFAAATRMLRARLLLPVPPLGLVTRSIRRPRGAASRSRVTYIPLRLVIQCSPIAYLGAPYQSSILPVKREHASGYMPTTTVFRVLGNKVSTGVAPIKPDRRLVETGFG